MRNRRPISIFGALLAGAGFAGAPVSVLMFPASASARAPLAVQTPENLQTAHSTAQRGVDFFGRFAAKADAEGYKGAASLFRAAQRSQQVHVAALQKAMDALNVKPAAREEPRAPEVKSTKENLAATVEWANRERTGVLPAFVATARAEGQKQSETAFNAVRQALTEIGRFGSSASEGLEAARASAKDYYVCRTCGYVVDKLDFQKCPVCFSTRDNFERVR